MPLTYDLHSHSLASDGTLAPAELVAHAHAAGVDVLALTDHDETGGIAEAAAAAAGHGMTLVAGVEVSVTWGGGTVHIVGLGVDPQAPGLAAGLERLRAFRDWRAEEIGRRLAKAGVDGAYEAARERALGRIVSRTHFARFLVANGRARDMNDAFRHYLKQGKPGHVPGQWAELGEAVDWIRGAGGIAVVAHPARYDMTATKLRTLLGQFRDAGGEGLEVVSGSHSPDDCRNMARLAKAFRLYASAGSDFHDPAHPWVAMGRLPPLPADLTPVWQAAGWGAQPVRRAAGA